MRTRRFPIRSVAALALVATLLVACTSDDPPRDRVGPSPTTAPPPVTPTTTPSVRPSPTRPALPEEPPLVRGQVDTDCVNGWISPPEGSPLFLSPLGVIRRTTGVRGPLEVVDIRYFVGPESPPTDKGYLLEVQRWYVKVFARNDWSFQGRFLVEARRFGQGVVAVAPYDTNGFRSPDWVGFQYESDDATTRSYEGLPGEWAGIPYDFVEGGGGIEIPGLPESLSGCLDAT